MIVIVYLLLIALVVTLYALYIYVLLHVSGALLAVGSVGIVGVVLYNYMHTMWAEMVRGRGWQDSPAGPEPAYRQYYFRKAFHDYRLVVLRSWVSNRKAAEWVVQKGVALFKGGAVWFMWPLGLTFFLIAAVGSVVAAAAYLVFGLIHLLLVVVCAAVALSASYLLRAIESFSMLWRRVFLVCPNSRCHRRISLPIYVCPNCGAQHRKLIPGSYGMITRRCRCGTKLPTLFLLGRNRVPSVCPHKGCGRPLPGAAGTARNLHIPLVGGPASGKTSFLIANMCELSRRADRGELGLEFTERKYQMLFDKSRASFATGVLLDKTAEESPDAFLVNFTDARGNQSLLYMYDAAGEAFQNMDVIRGQAFFEYTHGILFLIDPFSLPQVQADFASALRSAAAQIRPSAERPQDVYDRLISALRELGGRYKNIPAAVVVTKSDAFDLARGIEAAAPASGDGKKPEGDSESLAVRRWLVEHGENNLILEMERSFKKIRYFHCSALGRLPDGSTSPFNPEGVLDPLTWVLGQYRLSFEADGQAPAAAASRRHTTTTVAPLALTTDRSSHGALISTLWLLSVAGLFYVGASMLVANRPWSGWPSPTSTPSLATSSTMSYKYAATTTDLKIRSGPGVKNPETGLAERGSRVRILSTDPGSNWCQIEVVRHGRAKQNPNSSDTGWVNSKFLSFE